MGDRVRERSFAMVEIVEKYVRDNPCFNRKQVKLELHHPGVICPSKKEARDLLAKHYKVAAKEAIIVMNVKTLYGGGKSRAEAHIYSSVDEMNLNAARFRKLRMGIEVNDIEKKPRRARKDIKTKCLKLRGKSLTAYKLSLKK